MRSALIRWPGYVLAGLGGACIVLVLLAAAIAAAVPVAVLVLGLRLCMSASAAETRAQVRRWLRHGPGRRASAPVGRRA